MDAEQSTSESVLGRRSCRYFVAAIVTAVAAGAIVWFLLSAHPTGGGDWGGIGAALLGAFLAFWSPIVVGVLSLIGVCLGVAGIYREPDKTKLAIVGVVLNGMLLIAVVSAALSFFV